MPGLVPFIPLIAAALGGVDANVQNKAGIKNAENAQTAASNQVTQNQNTAQGNLAKYVGANPGTAQPGSFNASQPTYAATATPLAGTPPPTTASPAAGNTLPPQVAQLIAKLQASQAGVAHG